ncbi:MAG: hypothetical protein ACI85I_001851 [Arenicella sp.]|jgi:hypothetical protein
MKTRNILFLICLVFILSCKDSNQRRKEIMAEKVVELNKEMAYWDNLKQKVISDGGNRMQELDKSLQTELEQAGIRDVYIEGTEYYEISFHMNWTSYPIGGTSLHWNSRDYEPKAKKGYHDNLSNGHIDVWGVGNGWFIMTDRSFM